MKNKIFTSITFFIIFLFFYLLLGIWGIFQIKKNEKILFDTKDKLDFHKRYSEKIHHLRDVNSWSEKNEYLFSIVSYDKNNLNTVLLQGDSWIESISKISESEKLLQEFSKKNKFNIYNAGVASFAPSVMHVQYKILKDEFNIEPNILVIYIDQTDIGDEYCRYRHNKVYSTKDKLLYVDRERNIKAVFDYRKIYEYSDLKFQGKFKTLLKFPFIKTKYFVERNVYLLDQIIKNGFENRDIKKCSFREIKKELDTYNIDSDRNFKKSLKEYLIFLKGEIYIKDILIVSFPHLNHQKQIYKVNVSDFIDQVLINHDDKRINHLNLSLLNFNMEKVKKMYKKGDPASHLNDEYHTSLFIKKILNELK